MTRCAVWVVSCFVAFLSAVAAAHAQTPGQIPVFVDSSGTVGDSTIAQDGGGNISLTSGNLTVNNTPGVGVWGESTAADGVHGVAHGVASSGVAGVNDAQFGVGVWGQNTGFGYGVYGSSPGYIGLYGSGGGGAGVYGAANDGASYAAMVPTPLAMRAFSTAMCTSEASA
jgi:hypothetical protein